LVSDSRRNVRDRGARADRLPVRDEPDRILRGGGRSARLGRVRPASHGPARVRAWGGIFIVFTEGIVMVGGALLLFAFNAPSIAEALLRIAGGRSQNAPVAQIALSYP